MQPLPGHLFMKKQVTDGRLSILTGPIHDRVRNVSYLININFLVSFTGISSLNDVLILR